MTVKEIVKQHLEKNGYDGLCRDDCGCGLDDFMPCAQFALEGVPTCCTPAYKHTCKSDCTTCGDEELCELLEYYSTEKGEINAILQDTEQRKQRKANGMEKL